MDAIPDAFFLELLNNAPSSLEADRVNVINMARVLCLYWGYDLIQIAEPFILALRMFLS